MMRTFANMVKRSALFLPASFHRSEWASLGQTTLPDTKITAGKAQAEALNSHKGKPWRNPKAQSTTSPRAMYQT